MVSSWGYDSVSGANSVPSSPMQNKGYTFAASAPDVTQYGWATQTNPQMDYIREIWTLSGKSWNLYYNDTNCRAIVETLQLLIFGADGLIFKSNYKNDNLTKADQRLIRRQIEAAILSASSGTRLDAGNQLSRLEIEQAIDLAAFHNGDAFAVRVTKKRKNDDWRTTVRVLESWRVRNPPEFKNFEKRDGGEYIFEGVLYSRDDEPTALYYISNPNVNLDPTDSKSLSMDDFTKVNWFTEDGIPNIIHKWKPAKSSQLRGFPETAHVLKSAQYLVSTNESYLTAKNAQANQALIIQTEDAELYAAAEDANAQLGPNYRSTKGGVAYAGPQSTVHMPDVNFNGADYGAFIDVQLRSWCASYGLPYKFVMASFNMSNMAVSRTELDQAARVGKKRQNQQIAQVTSIIDMWILVEAIARSRVRVSSLKRAMRGSYARPMGWSNDPLKDSKADTEKLNQGISFDQVFAGRVDFEENTNRRADEEEMLKEKGLSFPDVSAGVEEEADDPEETETNASKPTSELQAFERADGAIVMSDGTVIEANDPTTEEA